MSAALIRQLAERLAVLESQRPRFVEAFEEAEARADIAADDLDRHDRTIDDMKEMIADSAGCEIMRLTVDAEPPAPESPPATKKAAPVKPAKKRGR